jgi:ankyrin repeat protein
MAIQDDYEVGQSIIKNQLNEAILLGRFDEAKDVIDNGFDIIDFRKNLIEKKQYNCSHCSMNHLDVACSLFFGKDKWSGRDSYKKYTLYHACAMGDFELVKKLGIKKQNINTALYYASKSANIELIQYLLDKSKKKYRGIKNALHRACYFGNISVVRFLIVPSVIRLDPNLLCYACASGSIELVKFLINLGANIYDSEELMTKLFNQFCNGYSDIPSFILDDKLVTQKNASAMTYACYGTNVKLVKYLHEKGVALNNHVKDKLAFCCIQQDVSTIRYLISHGLKLKEQEDLFIFSCSRGYKKVTDLFISDGVDIHAKNELALAHCISNNRLEMANYLVLLGANLHSNDAALREACFTVSALLTTVFTLYVEKTNLLDLSISLI